MSKTDVSAPPQSLTDLIAGQDPMRMQMLMTTLALANIESQALMADVLQGTGPLGTISSGDPLGVAEATRDMANSFARNPAALMKVNMDLMQGWMQLWQDMTFEALAPGSAKPPTDKRFADPEWTTNPGFRFIRKGYELNSKWMMSLADQAPGLEENIHRRLKFFTQQITETLSPTNFLATNPQVLRAFFETGGESVLNGLRLARADVEKAGGKLHISQTDETPFKIGENIATAPGEVVFRNDLIELIQYTPAKPDVHARPLVIFPPWINKFYILDLRKENSMIRWLVDRGLTVFIVSWRSADAVTKDYTWDDYARRGTYAAIEAALQASGAKHVNTVGYCIGGTLLAATLAHMAVTGHDKVKSATFFASQSDFELAGDLRVFTDTPGRAHIASIIEKHNGVMPGSEMYETFNWLRPIDLVWRYVIDQYMLGKPPRPFDLLYWNADQTNIPGPVHTQYLNDCYAENRIAKGEFVLLGEKINLKNVKIPVLVQSSREDHICPFESVYRTAKMFGGETEFVLAGSGHIAGVVNHPDAKKYQHWTAPKLAANGAEWLAGATEHPGSWWPHWWSWLEPKSGKKQKAIAPKDMGLGPAPGRYVSARMNEILP
jgi:polyhydroxyalkanoate synthase subunit PhaC